MNALIITGGEAPSEAILKGLAESADFIVAADSGLDTAAEFGIIPHSIIGDFDSIANLALLDMYPKADIMKFSPEKDDTDTELALCHCVKKGADKVVIAGGGGGRMDHLLGVLYLFRREKHPLAWHTSTQSVFYVGRNETALFSTMPAAMVSIFPLMGACEGMSSQGLKWSLAGLSWKPGGYGISNQSIEASFRVSAGADPFLVFLDPGAKRL